MLVDDPQTLAAGARTELQAARALAQLESEISFGKRPEEWYRRADAGVADLLTRFPEARQRDAYGEAPTLSPAARTALREPPLRDDELPGHVARRPPRRRVRELLAAAAVLRLLSHRRRGGRRGRLWAATLLLLLLMLAVAYWPVLLGLAVVVGGVRERWRLVAVVKRLRKA